MILCFCPVIQKMYSTRLWRKSASARVEVEVRAVMVFPLSLSRCLCEWMCLWVSIYIVFAVAFMRKTFVHSLVVSFIQAMNCWQTLDSDQCFAFPHIPNSCAVTQMMLITYKSFQTKCLCWNVYSTHTQDSRARKWFHNLFWLCVWHQGFSFILTWFSVLALQNLLNIRIWWKHTVSVYSKIIWCQKQCPVWSWN